LLIQPCSNASNDGSVRWQAYRLMSLSYILKGNNDSSRIAAELMLDINPTYKPDLRADPAEFISLLKRIVVIPKFTLGISVSLGTNTTFPDISTSYVVADYLKTYKAKTGYQFGTNIGFYLSPKVSLDLGLLATSKGYDISYSFTDWNIKVNERLTYLDIPFIVKYHIKLQDKWRLFLQGGGYAGYLLYAQNNFSATYVPQQQTTELSKLSSIERRNRNNFGLVGGLGFSYSMKQGIFSLQANYYKSLSPIVKSEGRYLYNEQIYTFFYLDDDITLNNLAISAGYNFNLNYAVYKHNKRK
jgi:hypothetical protein